MCIRDSLWNVLPQDGLMPVASRPQPVVQPLEVLLEIHAVGFFGDAIHPDRRARAQGLMGAPKRVLVDEVGE